MTRRIATVAASFFAVALFSLGVSAETNIPTFDPEGDLDLDDYDGSERPQQQQVLQAFEGQFGEIDECVYSYKAKANAKHLEGEAVMHVLLNPGGELPIGVNADMPQQIAKKERLVRCLRSATARAHYPGYDGPPVVVDLSFELDPA